MKSAKLLAKAGWLLVVIGFFVPAVFTNKTVSSYKKLSIEHGRVPLYEEVPVQKEDGTTEYSKVPKYENVPVLKEDGTTEYKKERAYEEVPLSNIETVPNQKGDGVIEYEYNLTPRNDMPVYEEKVVRDKIVVKKEKPEVLNYLVAADAEIAPIDARLSICMYIGWVLALVGLVGAVRVWNDGETKNDLWLFVPHLVFEMLALGFWYAYWYGKEWYAKTYGVDPSQEVLSNLFGADKPYAGYIILFGWILILAGSIGSLFMNKKTSSLEASSKTF